MRRIIYALGFVLCLGTFLFAGEETGNIPDPGFESGNSVIESWSLLNHDGSQGTWAYDTERTAGRWNEHENDAHHRALSLIKTNPDGYCELVSNLLPVKQVSATGPRIDVASGMDYEARAAISVYGRTRADIYLKVSQYKQDGSEQVMPDVVGTPEPNELREGWKIIRTFFKVYPGVTHVRIHAVISGAPAKVSWDDVELVSPWLASQYRTPPRYEPPSPEVLPDITDTVRTLVSQRKPASASLEVIAGRARLVVDGKLTSPLIYNSPPYLGNPGQIGDFRDAGVHIYTVQMMFGAGLYPSFNSPIWLGPGKYNFSQVDNLLWRILRVDPNAYIIINCCTDPYVKWGEEFPTEAACNQNGLKAVADMHPITWGRTPDYSKGERYAPSPVSSVLREQTGEVIQKLIRHVQQLDSGKAVIGYNIMGGYDGGGLYNWAQWNNLADYSEGSLRSFRIWLRDYYKKDEKALKSAWNQPEVTFDTAMIPGGDRRLAPHVFLIDSRQNQDIADYNRFYSEGIVETRAYWANIIKKETKNKALVGLYTADVSYGMHSADALGKMVQCKDIDYWADPAEYFPWRPAGEVGKCTSIFSTVRLHNKIFISELDFRSWLTPPANPSNDWGVGRATTAEQHNAMVRRDCGMMLAYGHGAWWYDMTGGWFHDKGIMKGIEEARKAFDRDLSLSGAPQADVAVFISEHSFDYIAESPEVYSLGQVRSIIVQQLGALNASGVPYHLYLQEDITNKAFPDYKVYLFLNPYDISREEKKTIDALKRDGKTLAFVHMPAVVGAADPAAAVQEITGIRVRDIGKFIRLNDASLVPGSHPLVAKMEGPLTIGSRMNSGYPLLYGPAFEVTDPEAVILGKYHSGQNAVAGREFGTEKNKNHWWKSVFIGDLGFSDEFFWNLAKWGGAWCATDKPGDAIYINQHFATIHATTAGEKMLYLKQPSRVEDLSTGKVVAERTSTIPLNMKYGETRWFFLSPQ